MTEEQLDRIDSYVLHKMTDEEVCAFEKEMNADESLANEVRDTEMIVEALAERERKRQSLEQFKSSYPLYKQKVEQLEAERNAAAYRVACEAAVPEREAACSQEYRESPVASGNKGQGWKWISAVIGIAACVVAVFLLTLPNEEKNTPMKSAPETPNEEKVDSIKEPTIRKIVKGETE